MIGVGETLVKGRCTRGFQYQIVVINLEIAETKRK